MRVRAACIGIKLNKALVLNVTRIRNPQTTDGLYALVCVQFVAPLDVHGEQKGKN